MLDSAVENAIAKQFQAMTAYEFLARYKPQTLEFVLALDIALQDDEQKAAAIAAQYGLKPASGGRYPAAIWERVFHPSS
jgi:hypothetical protein